MLQIRNLTYLIGDRTLLDDVDWLIQPGKRAALIGPNGAGKTTLLKIINEELEYRQGSIIKPKEYRIGYLPQEEVALPEQTVLKTVLDGQKEIIQLEQQIQKLHQDLETHTSDQINLLNRLGTLEHRFNALDGYHVENTAKSVLTGLGFLQNDLNRPLSEFSGGWRMRVYLAMLLVRQPDLLLLDEPTNHLDLSSLEWLEQYLLNFKGSIITVSHDRFFIDRLAQEIVELDRGKLVHYSGNYHFYETQKEQREAFLLKRWKEQKEERERQERFINRFRYQATKAAAVQSRIKMLEKMEDIDIAPPPRHIDFSLQTGITSFNDVLTITNLYFRYDDSAQPLPDGMPSSEPFSFSDQSKDIGGPDRSISGSEIEGSTPSENSPHEFPWVLKDINLNIYRGDKVSLVGINGAGKTTLTRLIVNQLVPQQGTLQIGERTTIGYYAQHQTETLDLESTVYDEIASTAATCHVPRIRDILGVFQFSGDDVYKRIRVLSGGEKARVSLAKILLSPVNFLIMDEPTNHLDKFSKEALERALSQYNGTLLLISHDRYFLDKLVNRVVELRDGHITEFRGNYSYYLEKRDAVPEVSPTSIKTSEKVLFPMDTAGKKTKEQKRQEALARQAVSKERNILQNEISSLEDTITRLESAKETLEQRLTMQETYSDSATAISVQKEYASVTKDLETANLRWEQANLELEELIASIPV